MMLSRSVERLGHEIVMVYDGDEAWEHLCEDDTVAIAIVDWMMPRMTGLDLCARIRHDQARARNVFVLVETIS